MTPADQLQRDRALDTAISCCVQAPAGSGKTELLTQRILKLLAICERPEEILAITFTRKAAAEMRNRLLENLKEAAQLEDKDIDALEPHKQQTLRLARKVIERDIALEWSLLENTGRLRINTIDSFNQFLVNQLPVTSSLGMLPDITEKPAQLFSDAVRETLKALEDDSTLSAELAVLLTHLNNQWSALENLFCKLLYKRDQWLGYILYIKQNATRTRELMEQTLVDIIEKNLSSLDTALSPYLPRLIVPLQFAVTNLCNENDFPLNSSDLQDSLPDCRADCLPHWQSILAIMLKKDNCPRQKLAGAQGFPAQSAPGSKEEKAQRKQLKADMESLLQDMAADSTLLSTFAETGNMPTMHFDNAQWRVLESLTIILPALVSRLNAAFAQHGKTDYPHVSAAALDALGEDERPTDLALRLDYHLKHILVDEFQDTSSMQINLLRKLTSGWQPGDGRTLFIVGDGMQSCYGFRNARVGLFLAARDRGIGEVRFEDLRLSSNFRSESAVVNWVNAIFRDAFPPQDDIGRGGVSFNPATAVKDSSSVAGVRTCLVAADKALENAVPVQRHREAQFIADTVESIQASCPGNSIAILVRGKSHLREIIPAFRERKLQWNASEIDPLLTYAVIRDLLSLTRALLNTGDDPAWLALLRSPVSGMPLGDIQKLSFHAREHEISLWQAVLNFSDNDSLSNAAVNIIERIQPLLALAMAQRQRLPLRDWLENTWVLLGGPVCVDEPELAENTEQFFALLEEHDNGGDIANIHHFENELNALFGSGQHPDSSLQIMTIHKAKGLEFDHVIIPGLDRRPRGNENPLLLWKEHISDAGDKSLVISLPSRKGQDRENDPIYRYLKNELELEQRLESTRLLYIAVTRAIRQAILVACVSDDEGEVAEPVKTSLLARIWPPLSDRLMNEDTQIIRVDENTPLPPVKNTSDQTHGIISRRLPPDWRNTVVTPQQATNQEVVRPDDNDYANHNLLEKKTGDIIHQCLMRIAEGTLDIGMLTSQPALEASWRRMLAPLTDDTDAAVSEIYRQLETCRSHEKFNWLVRNTHDRQACELSLSDYSRGSRQEYIIDRTFLDENGVRWIVDYKSSSPGRDESLEAFTQRQEANYHKQLADYARLFSTMEDAPVRAALFFPGIPCFHEVML